MYISTNTPSIPAASTETTTLALDPSTSSYATQTDLVNSINVILKTLESITTLIANQDVKFEEKIENQVHPLSPTSEHPYYMIESESILQANISMSNQFFENPEEYLI